MLRAGEDDSGRRGAPAPASRSLAALWVIATLLGSLAAACPLEQRNQDPMRASAITTLTAPDGSTFVLVVDTSMPLVHWAIATPADDPVRLPGLALTTMRVSLNGTWYTGSMDAEAERRALREQDDAYHAWFESPGSAALAETLARCTKEAERLGDTTAFHRVLASVPVHQPEIVDRFPACELVLTTVPAALADTARILVERREQPAFRDLQATWARTVLERAAAMNEEPNTALRAEILALAIPEHPFGRAMERPASVAPRRSEALATWQATQHPTRTVHVLIGGFDSEAVKATLQNVFATTSLPGNPSPIVGVPRGIGSMRRSVVTGMRVPTLAIAFLLPPITDHDTLAASARWLGDGPESHVGQELQRAGHTQAVVRCTAPWPPTRDGRSLLLLEVTDPGGLRFSSDQVLQICSKAAANPPTTASLQAVLAAMQREWTALSDDPRRLACALAEMAFVWPGRPLRIDAPDRIEAKAVQTLLGQVLAGHPVVVEGRP